MFSRLRIALALALLLSVTVPFFHGRRTDGATQTPDKPTPPPPQGGAAADSGDEVQFTPQQLQEYYKVYRDPYVKYLRNVFNAYLAGAPDREDEFKLLSKFDRDYYKSKFVVLVVEDGLMGGSFVTIAFQDRPDKVFKAWVYRAGSERRYELRSFEPAKISDDELKQMQVRYRRFLQDKVHAL